MKTINPDIISSARDVVRKGGLQTTDPVADLNAWRKQNGGVLPSDEAVMAMQGMIFFGQPPKPQPLGNSGQVIILGDEFENHALIAVNNPKSSVKLLDGIVTLTDSQGAHALPLDNARKVYFFTPKQQSVIIDVRDFFHEPPKKRGEVENRKPSFVEGADTSHMAEMHIQSGKPHVFLSKHTHNLIIQSETTGGINVVGTPDMGEHLFMHSQKQQLHNDHEPDDFMIVTNGFPLTVEMVASDKAKPGTGKKVAIIGNDGLTVGNKLHDQFNAEIRTAAEEVKKEEAARKKAEQQQKDDIIIGR
jgi:hypothetical protein